MNYLDNITVVQSPSHVWFFMTPWTIAWQASLSLTLSQSSSKFMSIESVMPSNQLILSAFFQKTAFRISQHQGLFQWVGCLHQVAKVLELPIRSSNDIQGWFPLRLTGLISLLSKGLSRVFSSTTVWKDQFIGALPSLWWCGKEQYCIWT